MSDGKPFFYRLNAADFLAAVVTVPEEKRADWVLRLALDLVASTHSTEFSCKLIDEARQFKSKKSEAGKKGAQGKWVEGESHHNTRAARLAYARSLGTHTKEEWEALKRITGYKCVRCGCEIIDNAPVKDHIIPVYLKGSDSIDNIQPLCKSCNSSKTGETTDYRPENWRDLLSKVMANVWQTSGECMAVPNTSMARSSNRNRNSNRNIQSKSKALAVSDKPKAANVQKMTDEEWLDSLKTNPAYASMNFDIEIGKAQAWASTKGRKCSRAFLLNWFNRADKVVSITGRSSPVSSKNQAAWERLQELERQEAEANGTQSQQYTTF